MKWKRIGVAGVLGGAIINVTNALAGAVVLTARYEKAFRNLGLLSPDSLGDTLLDWTMGFVLGITIAWTYAAIRPRFGTGRKTAIMAALALWVPYHFVHGVYEVQYGFISYHLSAATHLLGLIEFLAAAILTSHLYGRTHESKRAAAELMSKYDDKDDEVDLV